MNRPVSQRLAAAWDVIPEVSSALTRSITGSPPYRTTAEASATLFEILNDLWDASHRGIREQAIGEAVKLAAAAIRFAAEVRAIGATGGGSDSPAPHHRLRAARQSAGFTSAAEAARILQVPEVTYRAHENGIRGFDDDSTKAYAECFGVDPEWIRFGLSASRPEASKVSAQGDEIVHT